MFESAQMTSTLPEQLNPLLESLQRAKALQPGFPLETVLLHRLLHFAQKRLEQQAAEQLDSEGLLVSHWMVLAMLYGSAEFRRRPQELSQVIGHSSPNTTKTTSFLIKKGWVRRTADPDNLRSCWMELTPEGRQQVERILPGIWSVYEHGLAPLKADERTMLTQLLAKLLVENAA